MTTMAMATEAKITHITAAAFAAVVSLRKRGRGRMNPETIASDGLQVGQALKLPCRWEHLGTGNSTCSGAFSIRKRGQHLGRKLTTMHHEGYLYVLRLT